MSIFDSYKPLTAKQLDEAIGRQLHKRVIDHTTVHQVPEPSPEQRIKKTSEIINQSLLTLAREYLPFFLPVIKEHITNSTPNEAIEENFYISMLKQEGVIKP